MTTLLNTTADFIAAADVVTLSNPAKSPSKKTHTVQIVPTGGPDGTVSIKAKVEPTAPFVEVASVDLATASHILSLSGHYHQLEFSIAGAVGTTAVIAYIVSEE